jgi:hypothetical protein
MIVEIHNKMGNPQRIECSRVVIKDIYDSPIVVILEHAPGQYYYKAVGEDGFEQALRALGIEGTTVAEVIDTRGVASPPGHLLLPE